MKVTQEKLADSQIGLEIEIPAETSQQTYDSVVKDLARTTQIPGFRKGKIPRQVLIQRLGSKRIKAAALEELIQKSLEAAIKQEAIEVLGNYKLRTSFEELIQKYTPGQPFTFLASVDVPASVQLGDYHNLQVKAEEIAYKPEDVDNWLREKQEKFVTLVPVEDRPSQMGDVAIIDYEGKATTETGEIGEPIPGVQGTDFQVDIGEGKFIAGFLEGIVGMKPEETKELALTFPEDYPQEDLAGKPVTFTITLKELKAKELPEIDDDFAEQVTENSEEKFDTLAGLKEYLEKQYREKADKETKNNIQTAIVQELVRISTVELPETQIEDQVTEILKQTFMQVQQMGMDPKILFTSDNVPKIRENARPDAIERLKQSLVVREVAKVEALEPEDTAVEEKFNEVKAQLAGQDIDLDKLLDVVTDELRTEKTLNWLQEKTKVELVPEGSLQETSEAEEDLSAEVLENHPDNAQESAS
jgi:trigger factor